MHFATPVLILKYKKNIHNTQRGLLAFCAQAAHYPRKDQPQHPPLPNGNYKERRQALPNGGVLRPSSVRDAFGMRSGRKQMFVFTCEPSRSISILF